MLLLLFYSNIVLASGERDIGDKFKMNIHISGSVVVTGHCSFDSGSGATVGVDFGRIRYSMINGFSLEGNYRKPLNSAMTCFGDTEGAALMTFAASGKGAAFEFNGHTMLPVELNGTASKNLGIKLLVDGKEQDIGTGFSVDMSAPPTLEAELVQTGTSDSVDNGAVLTSSATLTMEFQ